MFQRLKDNRQRTNKRIWCFLRNIEDFEILFCQPARLSCLPAAVLLGLGVDQLKHDWQEAYVSYGCSLQEMRITEDRDKTTYSALINNIVEALSEQELPWLRWSDLKVEVSQLEILVQLDTASKLSMLEMIKYCPGRLTDDRIRLFLLFQIIDAVNQLHKKNLPHLGLILDNIFVSTESDCILGSPNIDILSEFRPVISPISRSFTLQSSNEIDAEISTMTSQWCLLKITNFDYLMFLNRLAGRRIGDPANSAILPWVTDFSSIYGGLRDLTKSKYRLTKGEAQLDANFNACLAHSSRLTSETPLTAGITSRCTSLPTKIDELLAVFNAQNTNLLHTTDCYGIQSFNQNSRVVVTPHALKNVSVMKEDQDVAFQPHHLLDMMPNLAYYTYMARRTSKEILTRHVRPVFCPNEFPSTLARLYESTPDECIPEFFTDPSAFKSIHADMPDLALPSWCASPEEFVAYHRSVLESEAVSSMLHHWIDLTFGYKLLGRAATVAKNVHLELAAPQLMLRQSGVTCLFRSPHPHRVCASQLETYFGPTCPLLQQLIRPLFPNACNKETMSHASVSQDASMHDILHTRKGSQILLPSNYNPLELINCYEALCHFLACETRRPFRLDLPPKAHSQPPITLKRIMDRDVEAIACLLVELYTHHLVNYRESDSWTHMERVHAARFNARLHWDAIPSCLHEAVDIVLQPFSGALSQDQWKSRFIPTASQLMHAFCEFPLYMYKLHDAIQWLHVVRSGNLDSSILFVSPPPHVRCPLTAAFVSEPDKPGFSSAKVFCRIPLVVLELLYPHIQQTAHCCPQWFLQAVHSVLLVLFATVGGIEAVNRYLLPLILQLYESGNVKQLLHRSDGCHLLSLLYSKQFLRSLLIYMGPRVFFEHLLVRLARSLLAGGSCDTSNTLILEHQSPQRTSPLLRCSFNSQPTSSWPASAYSLPNLLCLKFAGQGSPTVDQIDDIGIESHYSETEEEILQMFRRSTCSGSCRRVADAISSSAPVSLSSGRRSTSALAAWQSISESQQPILAFDTNNAISDAPFLTRPVSGPAILIDDFTCSWQESNNSNPVPPLAAFTNSIVWMARRVGPVFTSGHIIPHLLATLVLCYENEAQQQLIISDSSDNLPSKVRSYLPMPIQATNRPLNGDRLAATVVRCLDQLVCLYGVSIVLHTYLPWIQRTVNAASETIGLTVLDRPPSKSRDNLSHNDLVLSEWNPLTVGKLVAALTLLQQFLAQIPDSVLSDGMRSGGILRDLLVKVIGIAGRYDSPFPTGCHGRLATLYRLIDCVYVLGLRIGFEMTRAHMSPLFPMFFAMFDHVGVCTTKPEQQSDLFGEKTEILEEMRQAFTLELVQMAYSSFCRLAGRAFMENCLHNIKCIRSLVELENSMSNRLTVFSRSTSAGEPPNFISVPSQTQESSSVNLSKELNVLTRYAVHSDNAFHLRGPWSEAFEQLMTGFHSKPKQYHYFQFHGSRIASFVGHTGKLNCIDVVNTGNCFVTASLDKTVQLWSVSDSYNSHHGSLSNPIDFLRSRHKFVPIPSFYPTTTNKNSQLTYSPSFVAPLSVSARLVFRQHKGSVFAAVYLDNYRLVASCDGRLLLWDPCTGQKVRGTSVTSPLTALTQCPIPYGAVYCVDLSGTVYLIDPRMAHSTTLVSLQFASGSSLVTSLKDRSRNATTTTIPMAEHTLGSDNLSRQLRSLTCATQKISVRSTSSTTTMGGASSSVSISSCTLRQMAVCGSTQTLLCGFASGAMTAVDLRQLQVFHVWQGYTDAVLQLSCHRPGWFVSTGDRSLTFWHLKTDLGLTRVCVRDHCSARVLEHPVVGESNAGITLPGMSSVSRFAPCGEELIVCGAGTGSTMSNVASAVKTAVVESIPSSTNCDLLGTYRPDTSGTPTYVPLGRLPPNTLRGRATALASLPHSQMLLVGGLNGDLSLIY